MIDSFVLLAVAAAVAWGGANLLDKEALSTLSTTNAIAIKGVGVALTSLFFLAVSILYHKARGIQTSEGHGNIFKNKGTKFAFAAAISSSLGSLFFLMSLNRCTHTHIVAAIACTTPITTLLLSKLFLKNVRITGMQILAITLIVIGVMIATTCK